MNPVPEPAAGEEITVMEPNPSLSAPLRGPTEADLERFKSRLLAPFLEKFRDTSLVNEILWAANEAAALALLTICPLLALPVLLEEKVQLAIARWENKSSFFRVPPGNFFRRRDLDTH